MLIIEGADLVGKSTLVKRAVKRLNEVHDMTHMPMHLSRPPVNFDSLEGYLDKTSRATVWDRFHLSEIVYRQLDDHPSSMTPLKYELVDAQLTMLGGMVLVVTAEDEVIERRHRERGDDLYPLEHLLNVNARFRVLVGDSWCICRERSYWPKITAWTLVTSSNQELVDDWLDEWVDRYAALQDELTELLS